MNPLCLSLALCCLVVTTAPTVAQAQDAPVPGPSEVGDPTLSYAKNRPVVLRLRDGRALSVTPVAFDAETITVVDASTHVVSTLVRSQVVEVRVASEAPVLGQPSRVRHVGLQLFQGPGNVMLDFDYGHFYGLVGVSIGYPIIFSGAFTSASDGDKQYLAAAVAAGASWKLGARTNWKFDLLGTFTPTWWGGFSAGIGVAAGFHYTAPSGFTVGFKVPVFGVAPGCSATIGESTYDYARNGSRSDCQNRVQKGADLVANYYLQAAMSLPLISLGYRF